MKPIDDSTFSAAATTKNIGIFGTILLKEPGNTNSTDC